MDEIKISYTVYWRGKANAYEPDPEWHLFCGWTYGTYGYKIATQMLEKVIQNPRCAEAKIVKRTELFESECEWQRETQP